MLPLLLCRTALPFLIDILSSLRYSINRTIHPPPFPCPTYVYLMLVTIIQAHPGRIREPPPTAAPDTQRFDARPICYRRLP